MRCRARPCPCCQPAQAARGPAQPVPPLQGGEPRLGWGPRDTEDARLTIAAVKGMLSISDDTVAETQTTRTMAAVRRRSSGTPWEEQVRAALSRHTHRAPDPHMAGLAAGRAVCVLCTRGQQGSPGVQTGPAWAASTGNGERCPATPKSPRHQGQSDPVPSGSTRGSLALPSRSAAGWELSHHLLRRRLSSLLRQVLTKG